MKRNMPKIVVAFMFTAVFSLDVIAGEKVFCAFSMSGDGVAIGDGYFSGIIYFNINLEESEDTPNGLRQYSVTAGQANITLDSGNVSTVGDIQYIIVGDDVNGTSDVLLGRFNNTSSSGELTLELTEFRLDSLDTSTIDSNVLPSTYDVYAQFENKKISLNIVENGTVVSYETGIIRVFDGLCSEY